MSIDFFEGKTGVIFDFDGVICDSVNIKTEAFLELYKEYDQNILGKIREFHLKNGGVSRFEKIKFFEESILQRSFTKNDLMILSNKFSEIVTQKVVNSEYIFGSLQFLKQCKLKLKVFLCTATPQFEIEKILIAKDIKQYFDDVYGSPEDKYVLFQKLLFTHKLECENLIYFGDSISDYEVAKFYNIDFIGITNKINYFPNEIITFDDFSKLL